MVKEKQDENIVAVVGGGLAGCECAYKLAINGFKVNLYEMKKVKKTPVQSVDTLAELVCSNSLKSESITNGTGLLKKEMSILGSIIIEAAYETKVPSGLALSVDREEFSKYITDKILNNKNIKLIDEEITSIESLSEKTVVIATGPLTSDALSKDILNIIGNNNLYFYDAVAPIISKDCIDFNRAYIKDRYGETGVGDYLNLAFNKDEYITFYNSLINAKSAIRHEFDKLSFFEGCMPIEELARRGEKTLLFGPMKPVGLAKNEKTKPYAVLQLRPENKEKTMYNMVGFQTSLKFSEQERVFKMIPGLENINILRYGVMHKNTYIESPKLLNDKFKLINYNLNKLKKKDVYFAGQITGVEGYIPSSVSGLVVALNIIAEKKNIDVCFSSKTMVGALIKHISSESKKYIPMNANFGILDELKEKVKDKKLKYEKLAKISIEEIQNIRKILDSNDIK